MKTKHLFEDGYYLISNKAVAKCFMFGDETDCVRFKSSMEKHLKPLCDVIAFGLSKDAFQIIVKLKSRAIFEKHFLGKVSKHQSKESLSTFVPESTYIFAQAMANLQSGYVKYFNFKYKRDGGLMKSRYDRELIESEAHLQDMISKVHSLHELGNRSRIWTFRRKEVGFDLQKLVRSVKTSSLRCYEKEGVDAELSCFLPVEKVYVRGHFDNLPPKEIEFKNTAQKLKNLIAFMLLKIS